MYTPCIFLDELPRLLPEDDPEMLASLIKSESSDRVQRVSEPGETIRIGKPSSPKQEWAPDSEFLPSTLEDTDTP